MAETEMSEARLIALIQAYGSDPSRWPAGEVDAGREALARARRLPSRELAAVMAEADALDRALGRLGVPHADPGLTSRILADAPRAPASGSLLPPGWQRVRQFAAPALAAAACLAIGLVAGLRLATPQGEAIDTGEAYVLAALGVDDRTAWLEEADE